MYKGSSEFVKNSGWGRKVTDQPGKRYVLTTYHLQRDVVVRKEETQVSFQGAEQRLKSKKFGYAEILEQEDSKKKLRKKTGDPSLKSRYEERMK